MSVDKDIKAAITPLVAGGCHNGVNLKTPVLPYVVFHEISGLPDNGVSEGYEGPTNSRYQVDIFAATPEAAKGIALGVVKEAMEAEPLAATLIFQAKGQYSGQDRSHQYITEFRLWS